MTVLLPAPWCPTTAMTKLAWLLGGYCTCWSKLALLPLRLRAPLPLERSAAPAPAALEVPDAEAAPEAEADAEAPCAPAAEELEELLRPSALPCVKAPYRLAPLLPSIPSAESSVVALLALCAVVLKLALRDATVVLGVGAPSDASAAGASNSGVPLALAACWSDVISLDSMERGRVRVGTVKRALLPAAGTAPTVAPRGRPRIVPLGPSVAGAGDGEEGSEGVSSAVGGRG